MAGGSPRADGEYDRVARGEELVGLEYSGPFDDFAAQEGVVHRVIPWDEVALDEGSGIVHIAPGAGTEDFELSKVHDLPVLVPIDESGRIYPGYGFLEGMTTAEVEEPVIAALRERGLLVEAGRITHRYPICWRCRTPLVFRVVDDWFIGVDEVREQLLAENQTVEWTPPQYGKRMDDWLRNMGDWNISRKRYFGLPLPFYPCPCGQLNVVGSREELEERATGGLEQLQELHRPWIDEVKIRCESCAAEVARIPEVGDAWLDAGIVPLSTLGWQSPRYVPHGYATGAAEGLTGADLPDHAYWEKWFPADWISEMREQIRLWFYSQFFMSVTLVGRSPYRRVLTYEKLLDETGREMHRSWGNSIDANEAFDRMGADVMRWLFCDVSPAQNLKFGYGPAGEVKRRLLTLWNSVSFFVTYANIEDFRAGVRRPATAGRRRPAARCAGSSRGRGSSSPRRPTAFDEYWTPASTRAFESFVDDLSNWYIRRSRRRFYSFDEAAFRTLWYALVQALRVVAPLMPFLADELWRNLVAGACEGAPDSVHLAGWPEAAEVDDGAARRDRRAARGRRARPPGPRRGGREAAPAAAPRCASLGSRRRAALRRDQARSSASRRSSCSTRRRSGSATSRTCACSARGSAATCPRCGRRSSRATSRSSATAGCAQRATSSGRTTCSSSARRSTAGPTPTASRSGSTSSSTTSFAARAASTTSSTRRTCCARTAGSTSPTGSS